METEVDVEALKKQLARRKIQIIQQGLRQLPTDYTDLKNQIEALEKKQSEPLSPLRQASVFEAEPKKAVEKAVSFSSKSD